MRSKWLLVALLWGVALLNYLDRQVIFSQFPLLERDLHASSLELGMVGAAFLWVYGLCSPFAGFWADRWGHARTILLSLLVWSVATGITAHVHSMRMLLASRMLMGLSEAFYLPAALAMIVSAHGPATRSLATGIHQSGLYTGIILGGAWGGWMGQEYGWRPTFTLLSAVGVGYGLVLFALLRRVNGQSKEGGVWRALGAVARTHGFVWLTLAFGAISVANWIIYTWLPLFLNERFHLSLKEAGFTATFYVQAPSFAGMFASGILADRLSLRYPAARVWIQIAGLALTAPLLVLLGMTHSYGFLVAVLIGIGILRPWFDVNAMPVLRQLVPQSMCATGYGLLNMIGCLAGGVSASLAGLIKDRYGLATAYETAALVLLAGVIALLRLRKAMPTLVQWRD